MVARYVVIFVFLGQLGLNDISSWVILLNRGSMLVSYCPRGSVAKIGVMRICPV